MAETRPTRERKPSVLAAESAANAEAATALYAGKRERREARAKAAKERKATKPTAAAKKAAKTKKRTVAKPAAKKPSAAKPATKTKISKSAGAKKPAAKTKRDLQKTDEECPLESVEWKVSIDFEDMDDSDEYREYYKSQGNPISNKTLKFKAPAQAKWFTLSNEEQSAVFGPDFTMKNGKFFNYDITEDGGFSYETAMKIIEDHEANGNSGPPTIEWNSLGGYWASFELKKVTRKKGDFVQFRFAEATVEIQSPEEYSERSDY